MKTLSQMRSNIRSTAILHIFCNLHVKRIKDERNEKKELNS